MTEAKHTPGPWRLDHEGCVFGATGESILTGGVEYAGEPDETSWVAIRHDADARLIAAAPDMLAALKQLVELCSGSDENGHWSCWTDAEDAIAKAEGR